MGASMVKWTKIVYTKAKGLKVVAKCCLNWIFFMMISIVVSNTQMSNIKLRFSTLIIESDAQKQMIESDFEHRFHDLNYFEVRIPFSYSFDSLCTWGHHHNLFLENHKLYVILSYFKYILDNHLFNITYLHHLLKYVDFSWNFFCHHELLAFVD